MCSAMNNYNCSEFKVLWLVAKNVELWKFNYFKLRHCMKQRTWIKSYEHKKVKIILHWNKDYIVEISDWNCLFVYSEIIAQTHKYFQLILKQSELEKFSFSELISFYWKVSWIQIWHWNWGEHLVWHKLVQNLYFQLALH